MPTNIAMEILSAWKRKRNQNPSADQATLFKYILWERFADRMIADDEMEAMAHGATSLADLALRVLQREKPAMKEEPLSSSARTAIRQFFVMNYPEGL
ncbi:hypothetical protein GM415_04450 [Pseudodesulfovibrio cashew]|uniref:Uncharacterized protein n=1 Tax=Pseudodesulfovibrio cashew TaxID=2678688 RepID=A0A6I6JBF8_9BACT|nr:hypothetical protein [Pseudodesulfovibrio cashew]QGY39401.1 hypothetical protein GM415_04450 [Pseudodesulfovibrio cashew]